MLPRTKLLSLALAGVFAFGGVAARPAYAATATTVKVKDQVVLQHILTVEEVTAAQDGWIVINSGNDQKTVMGYAPVKAGKNENVKVQVDLSKATSQVSATLHVDEGAKGIYEFPGADMPVQTGSKDVSASFRIIGTDVIDQFVKDSKQVKIGTVIAAEDGWIVIHNGDAKFTVLGEAPIKKGLNKDITVDLKDVSKVTEKISAMIHVDKGTTGKYEFPGADVPAEVGKVVANEMFWTSDHVRVQNQKMAKDGTFTIESILAAKDGWIVLHSSAKGSPVIGYAPVKAGYNTNVLVKVDDPKTVTAALFAMLHLDMGTAGKYEFPGPDAPVKDAVGKIVSPEFSTK